MRHYLERRKHVNPSGIVPLSPELGRLAAHVRVKQNQQQSSNILNLGSTYLADILEAGVHDQTIS